MRAAAVSIPANVAEGQGRRTTREFLRFLAIANGSLRELDTYVEICVRRRFAASTDLDSMWVVMDEVGRLLAGLRRALKQMPPRTS